MAEKIRVLIQVQHTPEVSAAATRSLSVSAAVPSLKVPGFSLDELTSLILIAGRRKFLANLVAFLRPDQPPLVIQQHMAHISLLLGHLLQAKPQQIETAQPLIHLLNGSTHQMYSGLSSIAQVPS